MNNKELITVRIDKDLKEEAQEMFLDIGMSMSTAITIFLKQCVKEGKFPFELSKGKPSSGAGRKIKPLHIK